MIATVISGKIVDRLGRKRMILFGQVFIGGCLIGIVFFNKIVGEVLGGS